MKKIDEKMIDRAKALLEKMTLEENFAKLEEAVARLEADDISLEESFRIYKEGMELLRQCNTDIDKVEKQVLLLNEQGELEEFA